MDASLKTQYDIKNNVEDLQRFIAELKTWESDIKEKEQSITGSSTGISQNMAPPRNKKPKKETNIAMSLKEKKISGHDYKAWDKFDVDKACRDIDGNADGNSSNSSSDNECDLPPINKELRKQQPKITEEKQDSKDKEAEKLKNIDLAFFEKEIGNKLVKEEKWKEAIECYSKAINLDPSNQVYYANRSLCHIKLSNFKVAEVDSTIALQLDKTYLKAYQRRAFARKALQQLEEAKSDYEQILQLEPKNALARVEIDRINDHLAKVKESGNVIIPTKPTFDHKKMFGTDAKAAKSNVKVTPVVKAKVAPIVPKEKVLREDEQVFRTKLPKEFTVVDPIKKLPHQRFKCPLKKIVIKQVDNFHGVEELLANEKVKNITQVPPEQSMPVEKVVHSGIKEVVPTVEPTNTNENIVNTPQDRLKPVVKAPSVAIQSKAKIDSKPLASLPAVPENCVQFESSWKSVQGDDEMCYRFLKSIPTGSLKSIFGICLESWLLSQILAILASSVSMQDPTFQYEFLMALTKVERFTSLALFLSSTDQQGLLKCCKNLSQHHSSEEIVQLKKKYDL